jgi:hypothetical protein
LNNSKDFEEALFLILYIEHTVIVVLVTSPISSREALLTVNLLSKSIGPNNPSRMYRLSKINAKLLSVFEIKHKIKTIKNTKTLQQVEEHAHKFMRSLLLL